MRYLAITVVAFVGTVGSLATFVSAPTASANLCTCVGDECASYTCTEVSVTASQWERTTDVCGTTSMLCSGSGSKQVVDSAINYEVISLPSDPSCTNSTAQSIAEVKYEKQFAYGGNDNNLQRIRITWQPTFQSYNPGWDAICCGSTADVIEAVSFVRLTLGSNVTGCADSTVWTKIGDATTKQLGSGPNCGVASSKNDMTKNFALGYECDCNIDGKTVTAKIEVRNDSGIGLDGNAAMLVTQTADPFTCAGP